MHRLAAITSLAVAGLLTALGGAPHVAPAATVDATYARTVPTPTDTPSPAPTNTPSPTPSPAPRGRRAKEAATATPTPPPSPAASEIPDGTTPIPTQPPTPRPIAPNQPTVPDSMDDPNVKGILARPIPQLSQVGWMIGTWRAHNVEQTGDGRSVDLGINTYVFAATMKNRWIFGGDGNATDYFYITFDPFARRWVFVRVNANPAYGIWVSASGWHLNTIQFTSNYSYVNGRQYRRRTTIIRKDARTFGIYDEEQLANGAWTADDAVELTKQQ